ncbi:replication initiator protein [Microviridae sp.]|nr:replication initiator protein [Microviridae sp.]
MKCRSLITLPRTKTGVVPKIPCGQCLQCRLNKRDRWAVRVLLEHQSNSHGQLLTLTFSDEHLANFHRLGSRKIFSNFLQALRMSEKRHGNPAPIRSFGVLEFGETTHRPHFHVALWNTTKNWCWSTATKPREVHAIRPRYSIGPWPHGHVDAMGLNTISARYLCKYITKFNTEMSRPTHEHAAFYARNPPLGLNGLLSLIVEHSRSPLRKQPFEVPILLDGRHWDLPPSMRQHCLDFCHFMGMSTTLDPLQTFSRNQLQSLQQGSVMNMRKDEYDLRQEQVREKIYEFAQEKHNLRIASALRRSQLRAGVPTRLQ